MSNRLRDDTYLTGAAKDEGNDRLKLLTTTGKERVFNYCRTWFDFKSCVETRDP